MLMVMSNTGTSLAPSCARSGTRLQKYGGLAHLRYGVQVPAAPQCLFMDITMSIR